MLIMELELDTSSGNVIGTKEAVVQALEQFGEVRVKRCYEARKEPVQTNMYGRKK